MAFVNDGGVVRNKINLFAIVLLLFFACGKIAIAAAVSNDVDELGGMLSLMEKGKMSPYAVAAHIVKIEKMPEEAKSSYSRAMQAKEDAAGLQLWQGVLRTIAIATPIAIGFLINSEVINDPVGQALQYGALFASGTNIAAGLLDWARPYYTEKVSKRTGIYNREANLLAWKITDELNERLRQSNGGHLTSREMEFIDTMIRARLKSRFNSGFCAKYFAQLFCCCPCKHRILYKPEAND